MKRFFPIALFMGLVLSACSFSLAEDITPPPGSVQQPAPQMQAATASGPLYPLVPPDPANGARIYAEKCAPCHGATGQGDGSQASQLPNPPAALGDPQVARSATPADWYQMVTQGDLERFMPPFNSLSDGERWDVVAYALTLSASADQLATGETLYQENCAGCHGENGAGDGPQAADLGVELTSFHELSFMARQSQADLNAAIANGVAPAMPAFGETLSEDEIWALTTYLRAFTFAAETELAAGATPVEGETAPAAESTPGEIKEPLGTAVAAASDSSSGIVSGQISNVSGGEVPAGLPVTLRGFDDMAEVISTTVSLEADGSYRFEQVEMTPGRVFLVTVEYKQATYGSDIAVVEDGTSSLELPVSIYETTSDTSMLSVDRLHLFFEFTAENTVRVIQLYIMSNPSGLTLVAPAEGEPTLRFKLPEGAQNLEFQDGALGGRFIQTSDGFGDTIAIRPGAGTYEMLYAFEMEYNRKLDLSLPISYPVEAVVLLVPDNGLKIRSDMLRDEGVRDVQGAQYQVFNGDNIPAGSTLQLTLSGQPSTGGSAVLASGSSTSLIVGLGGFGLALIVAGVWLYRRSRLAEPRPEEEDELEEDAPAAQAGTETDTVDSLMDAIIVLDDLYQEGELPEEAYHQRRAELKDRLKGLLSSGQAND